jgi:beta-galactosidase GanA
MSLGVIIREGYFWVDDEKIPPLSGELHFWRNNRIYWPRILNAIQDLGFNHIATYVHWDFHQICLEGTSLGKIE